MINQSLVIPCFEHVDEKEKILVQLSNLYVNKGFLNKIIAINNILAIKVRLVTAIPNKLPFFNLVKRERFQVFSVL